MAETVGANAGIGSICVGGLTRSQVRRTLDESGVLLNEYAEILLESPIFDLREGGDVELVERGVGDLGLSGGATLGEVFGAAEEAGLTLCPADTGPYLRLALSSQENAPDSVLSAGRSPAGALKVASAPLRDDPEFPKGFYLRVVDGQRWLRGFRCDDEYRFSSADRFIFQLAG